MRTMFGVPVGTLAVVLVGPRRGRRRGRRRARTAQHRVLPARRAQHRSPGRSHGPDRRRFDARDDDHRCRARHRRRDGAHRALGCAEDARQQRRVDHGEGREARTSSARKTAPACSCSIERAVAAVDRAVRGSGLVDGVMPAIIRSVAVQDQTSRQTEPRVTLFAPGRDPARGLRHDHGQRRTPRRSSARSRRARSS